MQKAIYLPHRESADEQKALQELQQSVEWGLQVPGNT